MTRGNRIEVKREIYEWAIKESQKDFEEIKARFNKIEDWIAQSSHPTFRQLEELANFLKVPFGYMFLNKPPKTNVIDAEFRRIGNKIPNISKNLKDTIYDMSRKQNWISEYRKANGWNRIIPDSFSDLDRNDYFKFAKKAKDFLGLDEYWYDNFNDNRIAYNFLRDKIENKGILVMQSGIVGTNTRRKLDLNEFRGFMLYDDLAPLIFINTNDSQTGKIFTLIHEYIHILFGEDDIFLDKDLDNKLEREVNSITAEFLMPKSHIEALWDEDGKSLDQIEKISRMFNVSKLSLAIRLKELGLIGQNLVNEVKKATEKDLENKRRNSNGGDYYNTFKSRYSRSFLETVILGAESGDISYTYAFKLLDLKKRKTYDSLKERMMNYG